MYCSNRQHTSDVCASSIRSWKPIPGLTAHCLHAAQATLLSRRPALRRAAAATLRHLAERDPYLLLPERIEGALFASLDGEVNGFIAGVPHICVLGSWLLLEADMGSTMGSASVM